MKMSLVRLFSSLSLSRVGTAGRMSCLVHKETLESWLIRQRLGEMLSNSCDVVVRKDSALPAI